MIGENCGCFSFPGLRVQATRCSHDWGQRNLLRLFSPHVISLYNIKNKALMIDVFPWSFPTTLNWSTVCWLNSTDAASKSQIFYNKYIRIELFWWICRCSLLLIAITYKVFVIFYYAFHSFHPSLPFFPLSGYLMV